MRVLFAHTAVVLVLLTAGYYALPLRSATTPTPTSALVYAVIAAALPAQFVGLEDRTDALCFSVTLVGTVGSATSTRPAWPASSRRPCTWGNLIFIGTALRLLTTAPASSADA